MQTEYGTEYATVPVVEDAEHDVYGSEVTVLEVSVALN